MKNENRTSFSIIVPTYNNCKTLQKTIKQLAALPYNNYEIIIINDGSNDETKQVIDAIKNKKIRKITQRNLGVSAARNVGIKNASGDYIIFVDDDDVVSTNILNILDKTVRKKPKPRLCKILRG